LFFLIVASLRAYKWLFIFGLPYVYFHDIHNCMDIHSILASCEGFQWDKGNGLKNWLKHGVKQGEAEEIFFNEPLLFFEDEKHSEHEERVLAFGRTNGGRLLLVVFTIRGRLIRVISARNMNKKEKDAYEKA